MTENNQTTEQTDPTVEDPQVEQETEETPEDQLLSLPVEKLAAMLRDKRKAEATVRARLRDAEEQRDKLTGSVSAFQRQAFAQAAKGHRMQESALEDVLGAVDLASMLGDDGTVDPEKVGPALEELRKTKPHYFQARSIPAGRADTSGASMGEPRAQASWGDVLG